MINPVRNPKITSNYGYRTINGENQFHDGIDYIDANGDVTVVAIADGECIYDFDKYDHAKRYNPDMVNSGGNYVILKHVLSNGLIFYSRYMHLARNVLSLGQKVKEGEEIGVYGDVGFGWGSHCHMDIFNADWQKIDPNIVLNSMYMG